jgi:1-phosphatidylinositol-4-phosphate 5-kinase
VGRSASEKERAQGERCVYKDCDMMATGKSLQLGEERRRAFLAQLKTDAAFLDSMQIMDYSLLVGIARVPPAPARAQEGGARGGAGAVAAAGGGGGGSGGGEGSPGGSSGGRGSPVGGVGALPLHDGSAPPLPLALAPSRRAVMSLPPPPPPPPRVAEGAEGGAPPAEGAAAVSASALAESGEGGGGASPAQALYAAPVVPERHPTTGETLPPAPSHYPHAGGGIPGALPNGEFNGELYFLGIIDILQQYTLRKRGETLVKSLVHPADGVSSVSPSFYAARFVRFLSEHVT